MGKHHAVLDEEVWDELQRLKLDYRLDSMNQVIRKLIYEKGFGMPRYKEDLEEIKESLDKIKGKLE